MRLIVALRIVVIIHVAALLIQSSFAGFMIGGSDSAVNLHNWTGRLLVLLALVQLALVAVMKRRKLCPTGVLIATIGILVAEVLEVVLGYARIVEWHVPLGVAIFGGVLRQLFWVTREARLSSEMPA
jgi:hypothetical protein